MTRRQQKSSRPSFGTTRYYVVAIITVMALFIVYMDKSVARMLSSEFMRSTRANEAAPGPVCEVTPRFLPAAEVDSAEVDTTLPAHIEEFDQKEHVLPKYPRSEIFMVSVSSNNTHERWVGQRYTFGRIFDIRFITYDDVPLCTLCEGTVVDERCHCPSFRKKCQQHVFFDKKVGWWCATRKQIAAIKIALEEWGDKELPKWMHLLDDDTFVNPISELLLLNGLDPEKPLLLGDDWGGFAGGGPGKILSRGLLKKLIGPPVVPLVTYHWPNGTHSVTAKTQLESCLARWQGGDWCFFHGDWGFAECVREVGVYLTDLGAQKHGGFFTQRDKCCASDMHFFGLKEEWIAEVMHRTHSVATHTRASEMFDVFYKFIVPYYETLYTAFD